eukprot:3349219-Rhodomonas_salina.1
MVRPVGSDRNKSLGVSFAALNTLRSPSRESTVGRSGALCVFEVLAQVFPSAVRQYARDGVTSVELNKAMESSGFVRTRFRNLEVQATTAAEEGGCFRFRDVRWLDPD